MTPERIALTINPTEEYCARCESVIRGEVFIRDCEASAPYAPSGYCSLECVTLADEDAYDSEMANRVGR